MIQVMTELGSRALASALATSTEITFAHCAIGRGAFNPGSGNARAMDALIDEVVRVDVSAVRKESDGIAVITDIDNTQIAGGTEIREYGLYAQVNGGDEFLFVYGYMTAPETVPPPEEATYERRFASHIALSDDELELVVIYEAYDAALAELLPRYYATRSQVRERLRGETSLRPQDYFDTITEEQIADSEEVQAAFDGEGVETGTFDNVPSAVIADEAEVVDRFVNQ